MIFSQLRMGARQTNYAPLDDNDNHGDQDDNYGDQDDNHDNRDVLNFLRQLLG